MITGILTFLIETKLGRTIAISGAITIGLLIGWAAFKTHYYNQGWYAHAAAQAAQDEKAIEATNAALATVKACRDGGGTWDVSSGMCH